MLKLAVIGDLHHDFADFDVAYFNASTYDLLLLTGDLPYQGSKQDQQLVERLAALTKPALLIPGNHDCITYSQFIAEVKGLARLASWSNHGQQELVSDLRQRLQPVIMGGYSTHVFQADELELGVIVARPLSFGGPELTNRHYLETNFAIDSLEASDRRLKTLVDSMPQAHLVFLSHNGPTGLGAEAEDIWGCDFRREAGDYGDPDLEVAISYAKACEKQVPVVVAGHMHHNLLSGGERNWLVERSGTTYINAARVPRIFSRNNQTYHHHVKVLLDTHGVVVEERLVPNR